MPEIILHISQNDVQYFVFFHTKNCMTVSTIDLDDAIMQMLLPSEIPYKTPSAYIERYIVHPEVFKWIKNS